MKEMNKKLGLPFAKMKKITICFDVDGTLIGIDEETKTQIIHGKIRDLIIILSGFKNVKIIVWSGGGAEYAESICRKIGIDNIVDEYMSKITANMNGFKPEIAIDDIQDTALGNVNLIVRNK